MGMFDDDRSPKEETLKPRSAQHNTGLKTPKSINFNHKVVRDSLSVVEHNKDCRVVDALCARRLGRGEGNVFLFILVSKTAVHF